MAMGELTIQSIVRNEPFIYYSIKSVYDFADVILLYDTGSTDSTLDDIGKLLAEDYAKKIRFKSLPIIDETRWQKFSDMNAIMARSKKNFEQTGRNMASLRRQQITETTTEFFLLLDGDEICHRKTIEYLRTNPIHDSKICSCVRRDWYLNLTRMYRNRGPVSRLFRTDSVDVMREYPDEYHCYKGTHRAINRRDSTAFSVPDDIPPIAHFEPYLKPWRRRRSDVTFIDTKMEDLPEVMLKNDYFIRRYEEQRQNKDHRHAKRVQTHESVSDHGCSEQPPHSQTPDPPLS